MRGRRAPARWPLYVLLALLVGGSVAGLVAQSGMFSSDDDPDVPDEPLGVGEEPASYRIVYEVDDLVADDETTSTEVLEVRRPFDSRLVTRTGAPPGENVLSVDVAALGGLQIGGAEQVATVLKAAPRPAPNDVRLGPVLDAAVADGLLVRGERRTIEGRECDVYRQVDEGAVDRCVDRAGLVLAEERYDEGDLTRRKVAVSVTEDPRLDRTGFRLTGTPVPADEGGGSFARVTDESRPPDVDFWEPDAPPDGFRHTGRYVAVETAPGTLGNPQTGARLAVVADVYLAGPDLVVVENGGTTSGSPFPEDEGTEVHLGPLGEGRLVIDVRGAEVRVPLRNNRFVRVSGTLPPDRLIELAKTLERRPGGTLTTVPEEN